MLHEQLILVLIFIAPMSPVGRMYGVHTSYGMGDGIKLLAANNERILKNVIFRTY